MKASESSANVGMLKIIQHADQAVWRCLPRLPSRFGFVDMHNHTSVESEQEGCIQLPFLVKL
jgi:hypothetical protein